MGNKIIDSNYHKSAMLIFCEGNIRTEDECYYLKDNLHESYRAVYDADYVGMCYTNGRGLASMVRFDEADLIPSEDSWIWTTACAIAKSGGVTYLLTPERVLFRLVVNANGIRGIIRTGKLEHVRITDTDYDFKNLETGYRFKVVRNG